jgi:hypothetical protein
VRVDQLWCGKVKQATVRPDVPLIGFTAQGIGYGLAKWYDDGVRDHRQFV